MAEAYGKQGSRKTEELGELNQFMEHHLYEEQDEVRLNLVKSTNLSRNTNESAKTWFVPG
jgi:hypothetical protein